MPGERRVIMQGQHQGKRGRRIWFFKTGGPDSVTIIMVLCDDGEVVHVQADWTMEETAEVPHAR